MSYKYLVLGFLLILVTLSNTLISTPPLLYLGRGVSTCELDSPEVFYREVAAPLVSNLNEETSAFFGILLDKLTQSLNDADELDPEEEEELEKQWTFILETLQNSLDSALARIRKGWALIVAISGTPPLPWEEKVKVQLVQEFVTDLELQYGMLAAVIKAGVKEVLGTLQKRVGQVIQQLERHVAQGTREGEGVDEGKLLEKMEQSFGNMSSSDFITKLMRRIVKKAIGGRQGVQQTKLFFSEFMEQNAIVFEAYRVKGHVFPRFWTQITEIMKVEVKTGEVSSFRRRFTKDSELFADNVFAILVSAIPSRK